MNGKIRNIVLFVSAVSMLFSCAGEPKATPNKDKAEEYQIVVYQIKEKWGILQLEIGNYPDELAKMIEAAEKASTTTCEKCGAPGSLRDCRGWYHTLCDKCFEKQLKE